MNFSKGAKPSHPGFQMAPLIDIVFLLLVFFMVVTVYAQWERNIPIEVPTADSAEQTPRKMGEIIVNLDKEGIIYINEQQMPPERLENLLGTIASTFQGHPVIIRADKETDYQAVIQVLDICRKVDIWNVSFATLPPEEERKP